MVTETLLSQINAEIARLTQVRSLLAATGKGIKATERITAKAVKPAKVAKKKGKKRRTLSPEARKRIAEAQRKRWAVLKSKKK
jgi:hypothetical protein